MNKMSCSPVVTPTKITTPLQYYLKLSSSPRRKSSFFFPRMHEDNEVVENSLTRDRKLVKVDHMGTALPLFSITSSSCEYYALRLPLLRAGFKRISFPDNIFTPSNLLWGRSMPFRYHVDPETQRKTLRFAEPEDEQQKMNYRALEMTHNQQRFNHYPLSHRNVGCKRGLALNIRAMEKALANSGGIADKKDQSLRMYNFVPKTWIFPLERNQLVETFMNSSPNKAYIWKPARGSCGRGISITKGGARHQEQWEKLMADIETRKSEVTGRPMQQYVVQEYLDNPLLVEGRKMDLRLYVAVTSFDPLVVYLHEEGIVRLAAESYYADNNHEGMGNVEDPTDRFRYLTNYSIGRKHVNSAKMEKHRHQEIMTLQANSATVVVENDNAGADGQGDQGNNTFELKWSLQRFYEYIDTHYNGASKSLKKDIALIIVRTLMAIKPKISLALDRINISGSFFELYGFDIMIDSNLKPYLVEVNTLPSLESSSSFDYVTKTNVVADLLNLALIEPFEREQETLELISKDKGVLSPPPPECLPYIHTLNELKCSTTSNQGDSVSEDLRWRLQDELEGARGFKRIFPPLPPVLSETCGSPVNTETAEMQSDFKTFYDAHLLTKKDLLVVEALV